MFFTKTNTRTTDLLCWLLYFASGAALLTFHEPWRDELQAWAIALGSGSLPELFQHTRYEGHPSAWFVVLFFITRFTENFEPIKWAHLGIAAAAVWVFLRGAPFGRWQKSVAVLGYFFLFEYAVIARNYALGLLFAFLACHFLRSWKKNWLPAQACIFLLFQANLFAAFLAGALSFSLSFFGFAKWRNGELPAGKFWPGLLFPLIGALLSAADMLPPPDSSFVPDWHFANPDWPAALAAFGRAMLPLPDGGLHFWNSTFLAPLVGLEHLLPVQVALSVGLLAGCFFSLRHSPAALAFFGAAWLAISVFLSVKYVGFLRHQGHFFIAYLMALWLQAIFAAAKKQEKRSWEKWWLSGLLTVHLAAAGMAAWGDVRHPFSQSQNVADYLTENGLAAEFIVGHYDYATSPVGLHFGRPIYFPDAKKEGTYMVWSDARFTQYVKDISAEAKTIARQRGKLLLLTCYPVPEQNRGSEIKLLRSFAPAVVGSEEYFLYQVSPPASKSPRFKPGAFGSGRSTN